MEGRFAVGRGRTKDAHDQRAQPRNHLLIIVTSGAAWEVHTCRASHCRQYRVGSELLQLAARFRIVAIGRGAMFEQRWCLVGALDFR